MVYATKDGPITSKRREAWREGIEDVELWRHLRKIAEEIGDSGLMRLYNQTPAQLVKKSGGQNNGTPENLMKTRREVLQAVAKAMTKK